MREAINALMQNSIFLEPHELIKLNRALREAEQAVHTLEESELISTDEDQQLMQIVIEVANVSAEVFADDIRPRKFEWAEAWTLM